MLDVRELLDLGKAFSKMEFEQCRSVTALGYRFFNDFVGAVDEETLLRAGDGGVEELASREGAVRFFGQ